MKTTALDWSPEDDELLASGRLPQGPELVRIRTELLTLCRAHAPWAATEARLLLLWAEIDSESGSSPT